MKKIICTILIATTLLTPFPIFAHGHSGYGMRSTNYVRPYVKRNGTYVKGHLSGNPYSGVHCHKNVCY